MKNVLIVDDVKGWRDYHSGIINELFKGEAKIITTDCAQQAYDMLLEGQSFDIIITDLQMENSFAPNFAGERLVEQIETFNRYKNTKVVIISASYNIRHIAETLGVECIPKSTALTCISAYEELLGK